VKSDIIKILYECVVEFFAMLHTRWDNYWSW